MYRRYCVLGRVSVFNDYLRVLLLLFNKLCISTYVTHESWAGQEKPSS